ncbi:unnamed protein product [Linum tenue]|uniref:Uncharacterized protein n=1 Tax=Linum tenue TaxID=586396 RepID=A0AAV0HI29_9ROSI|nr:unnamed protein product [Linum tenue]
MVIDGKDDDGGGSRYDGSGGISDDVEAKETPPIGFDGGEKGMKDEKMGAEGRGQRWVGCESIGDGWVVKDIDGIGDGGGCRDNDGTSLGIVIHDEAGKLSLQGPPRRRVLGTYNCRGKSSVFAVECMKEHRLGP